MMAPPGWRFPPSERGQRRRCFTTDNVPVAGHDLTQPRSARSLAHRAKSAGDVGQLARVLERQNSIPATAQTTHSLVDVVEAVKTIETQANYDRWAVASTDALVGRCSADEQAEVDQLDRLVSHLDSIVIQTDGALTLISDLSSAFKAVEAQTTSLQDQSEKFVAEHARLSKLADDIADNTRHYLYLEPVSRQLNAAKAADQVGESAFSDTLILLDDCIRYMDAHPEHRDAPAYRARYRQLLGRALTLVRAKFTDTLREIATDVSRRISDKQLNDDTLSTLLYAKFRVGAPQMKRMALDIQKRAAAAQESPDGTGGGGSEYQDLMVELYQSYASARGRLVLPLISKRVGEMSLSPSLGRDLPTFTRTITDYLNGICHDEHELWNEWFGTDGSLYDFLEYICEPMFDQVRPRIIQEQKIIKLCETCTFLQSTYFDMADYEANAADQMYPELDFGKLVVPLLEDVQSRLVFLALGVVRNNIEYYKPTADLLDYPSRLQSPTKSTAETVALSGTRTSSSMLESAFIDEDGAALKLGPDYKPETWYPTLGWAVWLMSRIYQMVNSAIFDDLARQILHQTTASLVRASDQIEKTSRIDARLFMIKHLLLLKKHIGSFDLESGGDANQTTEFDFSGLASTFRNSDWLSLAGKLMRAVMNGDLVRLFPRVTADYGSAKDEVDQVLRLNIGKFAGEYAATIVQAPHSGWRDLTKGRNELVAAQVRAFSGSAQPSMPTEAPVVLCELITDSVPGLRQKLDVYLGDGRTKEMLAAAVMEGIVDIYASYHEKLQEGRVSGQSSVRSAAGSSKGKERAVDLWPVGLFSDWCDTVLAADRPTFD